ncbi:MAG: hypothetical protein SFV18_11060 [Bryobacteraceae bacterium]|nr:hypothetical protein [Bryobacteraceae bacterium]
MVRAVLVLLASIFLISLVRMFAGLIARAFSNYASGPDNPKAARPGASEMRKCVRCGTYAPVAMAPKVKGSDFYCSTACVEGKSA